MLRTNYASDLDLKHRKRCNLSHNLRNKVREFLDHKVIRSMAFFHNTKQIYT